MMNLRWLLELKWSVSLYVKIIVFVDFFAVAIVVPLIQTYFKEANIDTKLYAFISSAYMISQFGGTLLGGHIIDKLDKRTILILSFISSAISYLLIIIGYKFKSGYIMLGSRIIVGLLKNTYTISTTILSQIETNENEKVVSLGHLSAIMTAAFIIGPLLGSILFKYMKILPCIISSILFLINIIITLILIPKGICANLTKDNKEVIETSSFRTRMSSLWSKFLSISRLPNVGSLLTIRLLLSLFESSCSSRNIISYMEKRYAIESHTLGYISSLSSIISITSDGFLLPSIISLSSRISNATIIPLLIFFSALFNIIEFFNSSIYLYICITIIPQTLIQSVLSSKIKALQLQAISSEHFGKFLSILSLLGTGIGVISPLYGALIFSYFDGIVYRPMISAGHLLLLSFICIWLPFRDEKKLKEKDL
jgi:MFS family permease